MQKIVALALAGGLVALPVMGKAQDHPVIPANFKKVAACVYRALDAQRSGMFRLTDLYDSMSLTMEVHGGGLTLQPLKATFTQVGNATRLEVEGYNSHFAAQVRPLAEQCASGP